MSTQPMPVPEQEPTPGGNPASVSQNVAPIAAAAQQAAQPKQGVQESQLGRAPQAQKDDPSKKRIIMSVLGAAAGMPKVVQAINKQHDQNVQIRNQHVIDSVWQAHNNETQARNKVDQLKQAAQEIQEHMKRVQALPDDDPTKTGQMGYLAHNMQDVTKAIQEQAKTIQSSQQNIQAIMAEPKNRKIMEKAVGYDPKSAQMPERQQMIAAIQKSVPGTSPEEAQLNSQFPQGQSEAAPGLDPKVQEQVLKSATTQASIDSRVQIQDKKGATAVKTAEIRAGSIRGKTGVQFDNGVPYAWTAPDGKNYAANDPDMPPEGKMLMASAKAARAQYEKVKEKGNSAAQLRAQTGWANYLMHSQGIDMKGTPLAGAMQTDTGQTVGSSQAANVRPTGVERGRADLAASATEQMDDMKAILNRRHDLFGPGKGQINSFNQWIGSTDPDAQAMLSAAKVSADHLAGVFGGRSEAALSGIFNVIYKNRNNIPAQIRGIDQMYKAAKTIQSKGVVHSVGSSTQLGKDGSGPAQGDPLGILH